jgi:putative transposase
MLRKSKPAEALAPIPAEILDQIVRDGPFTAEEVDTATRRFKKTLIVRALGAELTHHLGYGPWRRETRPVHQSSQWDERENGAHG